MSLDQMQMACHRIRRFYGGFSVLSSHIGVEKLP